eukprot:TRINITY_DN5735_c0_g1_i1.p1 TRINITY_DN5735_c0_g1~~TRINITY_DN5735_c0_g1_i1.p1  ORF type:complete len:770 (-),score=149.18 TRINITY_DN5735_c0_g1_i1:15-2324(-)
MTQKTIRVIILLSCLLMISSVSTTSIPNHFFKCNNTDSTYVGIWETELNATNVDTLRLSYVTDNNRVVFIVSDDGHVYRSGDEGKTWTHETVESKMRHITDDDHRITSIYSAEDQTGVVTVYLLGYGNGKMWSSSDAGETYTYRELPLGIISLSIHPRFPSKLLGYRFPQRELYFSSQFGETGTWSLLTDKLAGGFSWTPFLSTDHPDGIYAHVAVGTDSPTYSIVYTEDFFKSQEPIIDRALWFRVQRPDKLIVAKCSDPSCTEKELLLATNDRYSLHKAIFPDGNGDTIQEKNYYLADVSDDSIWVYVSGTWGTGKEYEYGEVFRSNSFNANFYRTIPFVKYPDVVRVQSVEGVYVVNQYQYDEKTQEIIGEENVRTLISYNKGASWDVIPAPETDSNGSPTDCRTSEGCSLHLHGYFDASEYSWFYSIPNAVGLMIASGNIGTVLSTRDDQVNTYFTRDGGITWKEIRKGSYVPEIGDHGSVLVMAKGGETTNEIVFSLNDGHTWQSCQFSDRNYRVENIRVSQGWDSRKFVMYGEHQGKVIMAQLDFEQAFSEGKCSEEAGDFENWSPTDQHGECILGRETIYRRRKEGVECWFGEEHEHVSIYRNCSCTLNDFECAPCFDRQEIGGPCVFYCTDDIEEIGKLDFDSAGECNTETGLREISDGYLLVEGDTCDLETANSVLVPKGFISCDVKKGTFIERVLDSRWVVVALVVFLLLIIISVGFCVLKRNTSMRNNIKRMCGIETTTNYSNVITLTGNVDFSSEGN